jgi:hypothetical protein
LLRLRIGPGKARAGAGVDREDAAGDGGANRHAIQGEFRGVDGELSLIAAGLRRGERRLGAGDRSLRL